MTNIANLPRRAITLKVKQVLLATVVLLCARSLAESASQPVAFKRSADHIDVLIGVRLFTTYYFDPSVAKPYFQPLRKAPRGRL